MTDGLVLMQFQEQEPTMELRTVRTWLTLQEVDTIGEVVAACIEELRERRMMGGSHIPVSRDFGGIEED